MEEQKEKQKVLYTRREAAKSLGVSECTLDCMRRAGKLEVVRIGRKVMVRPEELARIAKEGA